jgi:hypothetical protein
VDHAIIDVERIITDCLGASRSCFYLRREYGIGYATLGLNVNAAGDNGQFWIGSAAPVGSLAGFFNGTADNLATGSTSYTLYVKPARWRVVGNFAPGQPLTQAELDAIRVRAEAGTRYKLRSNTSGSYALMHRVVRTTSYCGVGCIWMHLRREEPTGGEVTLTTVLSTGSDHAQFWLGSPVNTTTLSAYFGGTNSDVASGQHSFTLYADDGSIAGEPAWSSTCADWAALGWESETKCLGDGRFHHIGSWTTWAAGNTLTAAELTRVRGLAGSGADLRHRNNIPPSTVFDVQRVIPVCESSTTTCLYSTRERGTGTVTLGMSMATIGAATPNGAAWVGTGANVSGLNSFFTGAPDDLQLLYVPYTLLARPARWRLLASGTAGQPLSAQTFAEVLATVNSGAELKLRATSLVTFQNVLRVVRAIPQTSTGALWLYAVREHTNGGERTLGLQLATNATNGNYWVGNALSSYPNLASFFGGTDSSLESGAVNYEIFVDGECPGCAGSVCTVANQCLSNICLGGVCAPLTCTNGVFDGQETGPDCGGPACPACVAQGSTCLAIRNASSNPPSGWYVIDPDGAGGNPASGAWCDMTTDGGGWTVVLNATRNNNSGFATNYSNFTFLGTDTASPPSPSQAGRRLQGFAQVPFAEVAFLSFDGGAFASNCKWNVSHATGFRTNTCSFEQKQSGQGYLGLQASTNACYVADFGLTGGVKNYASAGAGATGQAIHTQWDVFGVSNNGVTLTPAAFNASRYAVFALYNASHNYFNIENCRTGSQQGFNSAVVAVR